VLRLVGFFVLAVAVTALLSQLPVVGPVFRHSGLFGLLLVVALLSFVFARFGERVLGARRMRAQVHALEGVDSAHNHGKIGALYLARGRWRAALSHLERASQGEPDVAEWWYRRGLAELAGGEAHKALASFERCAGLDEEYAYGMAQMKRAQALQELARPEEALEVLAGVERNHGPSPESAYRRGVALRSLGRKEEARQALAEVSTLARQATRYQRGTAGAWALRARLSRLL